MQRTMCMHAAHAGSAVSLRARSPCPAQVAWVYTVLMATLMGTLVGATQLLLGSPGDLPEVVHQIHTQGRIPIKSAPSMFVCSAFSIVAGLPLLASHHILALLHCNILMSPIYERSRMPAHEWRALGTGGSLVARCTCMHGSGVDRMQAHIDFRRCCLIRRQPGPRGRAAEPVWQHDQLHCSEGLRLPRAAPAQLRAHGHDGGASRLLWRRPGG